MQNLLIVGIIVVIGIGGFILLQPTAEPVEDTVVVDDVQVETEPVANDIAADTQAPPVSSDIVETAVATPELSTLVTAVTQAELVETLQSDGPFTVFAPVDDAFAALPTETLETLLLPENIADLQSILTYHVVPGAITSDQLTDGMQVVTVNGETITIGVTADGVSINGSANVAIADIETSNGIVHVIDSVLLPPEA
jgi:uncharacterized surface protein with fasciclin (FAS1) repeats